MGEDIRIEEMCVCVCVCVRGMRKEQMKGKGG